MCGHNAGRPNAFLSHLRSPSTDDVAAMLLGKLAVPVFLYLVSAQKVRGRNWVCSWVACPLGCADLIIHTMCGDAVIGADSVSYGAKF